MDALVCGGYERCRGGGRGRVAGGGEVGLRVGVGIGFIFRVKEVAWGGIIRERAPPHALTLTLSLTAPPHAVVRVRQWLWLRSAK